MRPAWFDRTVLRPGRELLHGFVLVAALGCLWAAAWARSLDHDAPDPADARSVAAMAITLDALRAADRIMAADARRVGPAVVGRPGGCAAGPD